MQNLRAQPFERGRSGHERASLVDRVLCSNQQLRLPAAILDAFHDDAE
jgi:hypothetical protein